MSLLRDRLRKIQDLHKKQKTLKKIDFQMRVHPHRQLDRQLEEAEEAERVIAAQQDPDAGDEMIAHIAKVGPACRARMEAESEEVQAQERKETMDLYGDDSLIGD